MANKFDPSDPEATGSSLPGQDAARQTERTDAPPRDRAVREDVFTSLLDAQRLAFAPVAFAVAKAMRDQGVLSALRFGGGDGRTIEELAEATSLSDHALRMMVEASLSFGLVHQTERGYALTRTGFFILNDPMTRANMDFVHDVCFQGLLHFQEAITTGRPSGLAAFGEEAAGWDTIYQGLSQLPERARKSWLDFDHYYSDAAFPPALAIVMKDEPRQILDVGGNTGRFARAACDADPDLKVTIADHEGQLALACEAMADTPYAERIDGFAIDLLDETQSFPVGYDAIWMSQFLVCFSEAEIVSILRRARRAMGPGTALWVLDTYWDNQRNAVASYCLHGMSPYFTCMANGNSRVYRSEELLACVEKAGLRVTAQHDGLGRAHTLMRINRA